eukprot:g1777.t1
MCDSMDGRVIDPSSPVSKRMRTPAFDQMASTGVNFISTYAASPQCVPSRTTMLVGRRSDQTRTWSNGRGFAADAKGNLDSTCVELYSKETCQAWKEEQQMNGTFFDVLKDNMGYDVNVFGKVDVGAGVLERFGPHATADGFHGGPSLSILTRSADIRKPTKPNPMNITNDNDNNVHPEDWRMIGNCIDWLRNKAADNSDNIDGKKPWFMYCSLNIPHPPFNTNASWLKGVNESNVDVPPSFRTEAHPYDTYMSDSKAVDGSFSDEQIKEVRDTYYAMVTETDYMLGSVLQACKDAGIYDNTIVIFLSDHGEMNMEHRQVWKNAMYEASSRVPLVVSAGEKAGKALNLARGTVVKDLVSLLDIFPTLMSFAGSKSPRTPAPGVELSGYSLVPFLTKEKSIMAIEETTHPDYVVSQYYSNMGNTACFMVRQGKYKYITFGNKLSTFGPEKGYTPQLFDLQEDPSELTNIAKMNPDIVQKLDTILRRDLSLGTNIISPVGDYQEIDRYVKAFQQNLYEEYFVSNATLVERQWNRLLECVKSPPPYFEDSEREAPCLAGGNNVDLDALRRITPSQKKLRSMFEQAYRGFDDTDWEKVQAWIKEKP